MNNQGAKSVALYLSILVASSTDVPSPSFFFFKYSVLAFVPKGGTWRASFSFVYASIIELSLVFPFCGIVSNVCLFGTGAGVSSWYTYVFLFSIFYLLLIRTSRGTMMSLVEV